MSPKPCSSETYKASWQRGRRRAGREEFLPLLVGQEDTASCLHYSPVIRAPALTAKIFASKNRCLLRSKCVPTWASLLSG